MKTMSIYQISQFDLFDKKDYERMGFQSDITDNNGYKASIEPITELKLINPNFYRDFSYIEITHESQKKDQIRIKSEFYDLFFMMQKTVAFYNPNEKILLITANKELSREIVDRIADKFHEKFKLVPIEEQKSFDFKKITNNSNLINTWGAWFKNIGYGNVTSMALFGDHVQLDSKYEENFDKISSLNVDLSIDGKPLSLIISKDLRITVLSKAEYSEMIDYYFVVKNLFT